MAARSTRVGGRNPELAGQAAWVATEKVVRRGFDARSTLRARTRRDARCGEPPKTSSAIWTRSFALPLLCPSRLSAYHPHRTPSCSRWRTARSCGRCCTTARTASPRRTLGWTRWGTPSGVVWLKNSWRKPTRRDAGRFAKARKPRRSWGSRCSSTWSACWKTGTRRRHSATCGSQISTRSLRSWRFRRATKRLRERATPPSRATPRTTCGTASFCAARRGARWRAWACGRSVPSWRMRWWGTRTRGSW